MAQTINYGLPTISIGELNQIYGKDWILNLDGDHPGSAISLIDAILQIKADLDPSTMRILFRQLPDMDFGGFESATVEEHNEKEEAHTNIQVDGNVDKISLEASLAEHMASRVAHQNIHLDGNLR